MVGLSPPVDERIGRIVDSEHRRHPRLQYPGSYWRMVGAVALMSSLLTWMALLLK